MVKSNHANNLKQSKISFVYFAIISEVGHCTSARIRLLKIGHSAKPIKRIRSYGSREYRADIIHTIEFDSKKLACAVERGFHRIFENDSAYCDSREWFKLNEATTQKLSNLGVSYEAFV